MDAMITQIVVTTIVVCLFLWRISYGAKNGLFAEAAGLIAAIASFAGVYYIMRITSNLLKSNYGGILRKVICLVIAFLIYKVMRSIAAALQGVKKIPILGRLDRFLGAVFGAIEAWLIIYVIEYITGMDFYGPVEEILGLISAEILRKIKML